jgi:exodeoxyribonuclease V alpha subunit
MMPPLEEFLDQQGFSTLDRHLARQVAGAAAAGSRLAGHAAALASAMLRRGHTCLDLSRPPPADENGSLRLDPWPDLATWRQDLGTSGVVADDDKMFRPLVLDASGHLYLHRYCEYERRLAEAIRMRVEAGRFRVIVGGPGTGKTTRILQDLVDFARREPPLVVALAAPTGKAAHRMEESIRSGLDRLVLDAALRERIPCTASTLHRLLGSRGDSAFFRHDATNPLTADVIIVDEASMVDLPLMSKLLTALKPAAEVVLVGDPDQLASVEAGSVLADIAAAALEGPDAGYGLAGALTTLQVQHRYGPESGIGKLCAAIRAGDGDAALAILRGGTHRDVRLLPVPDRDALAARLQEAPAVAQLRTALEQQDPQAILRELGRSRILCPTRRGLAGVESINGIMERLFDANGIIRAEGALYDRKPVVLTRNDYGLQLFNGDTGIVIDMQGAEAADGAMQAFFQGPAGELRRVPAVRLPPRETAFAMTVHRSQGSEFDRVLLILPPGSSPVLSRELLYTAVSRARLDVEIWGDAEALRAACSRQVQRTSGLAERLR